MKAKIYIGLDAAIKALEELDDRSAIDALMKVTDKEIFEDPYPCLNCQEFNCDYCDVKQTKRGGLC